jgi:hypothetical protein
MMESKQLLQDLKDAAFNHAVLQDKEDTTKAAVIKLALLLRKRRFPQDIFRAPGARTAFEDHWNHMLRYEQRGDSNNSSEIDLLGREIDPGCVVYDFLHKRFTYR